MQDYVVSRSLAGDEIRKFADARIQTAIEQTLTQLQPGVRGAVVLYGTGEEVRAGVYGRIGSHWSYVGTLGRRWDTGRLSGEAAVAFTF